ncbi:hypothetical protein [Streptomyces sp. NPDC017958]|uniref:hypothetical protein n=1 Tax=Streptomyces sp. NPDC017958 TaxID=3365021 RepID=UPI0037A3B3D7
MLHGLAEPAPLDVRGVRQSGDGDGGARHGRGGREEPQLRGGAGEAEREQRRARALDQHQRDPAEEEPAGHLGELAHGGETGGEHETGFVGADDLQQGRQ